MMAVRNRGQSPNFWYNPMCFGLCAKVKSPVSRIPHFSKRSTVGPSSLYAICCFHNSGSTVSGPKKPKLPQFVATFEPANLPFPSATKAASGAFRQRVKTYFSIRPEILRVGHAHESAKSEAEDPACLHQILLLHWPNRDGWGFLAGRGSRHIEPLSRRGYSGEILQSTDREIVQLGETFRAGLRY
jgi:hypothetical protein